MVGQPARPGHPSGVARAAPVAAVTPSDGRPVGVVAAAGRVGRDIRRARIG